MSLNIKNEGVHTAVRQLADALGVSQTSAVELAVREKLADLDGERRRAQRANRIAHSALLAQQAFRDVDLRSAADDLYDPVTGLPR